MKAFAVSALALALVACSAEVTHRAKPPVLVETIEVQQPLETFVRQVPGVVVGADQTLISFRVEGRIERLIAKEGKAVKAGDVLAVLDDVKINHQLDEAKANRRLAESQLKRAEKLYKKAMLSDSELDRAKANYALTKANEDLARRQLKFTQLVAPVDGVVAQTFVENREFVEPGKPVLALYRTDRLDVELTVSDTMITQLGGQSAGQSYQVLLNRGSESDTVQMEYLQHTFQPDPETNNYQLWLSTKNYPSSITPGTRALVTIPQQAGSANAFLIPATALDGQKDEYHIWVIEGETSRSMAVNVIDIRSTGVLIEAPIQKGMTLANSGLRKLSDGLKVVGKTQ
ncbi:efflux RND transporter periplasmic adaptor subunit [Vibrio sonorensis]|uniref:efflux RND transporter periplasmic adaptor subunit n=1 Tax=Vibrio sonorensis TaxID=1004316 RepID=UPI0008DAE6B4|nr:efflux RND transporter periplasmic adaptor subunit [Vibrio sonorensis]